MRHISQTDRYAIGDITLRMLVANAEGKLTETESEALIFSSSYEASVKMHELEVNTDHELEILPLDPSQFTGHDIYTGREYIYNRIKRIAENCNYQLTLFGKDAIGKAFIVLEHNEKGITISFVMTGYSQYTCIYSTLNHTP